MNNIFIEITFQRTNMHQFVMNVESNIKLGTFIWLLRPSDFHAQEFLRMWWILRISYEEDKSGREYMRMWNSSFTLPRRHHSLGFLWNNSENYFHTYCTIQRPSATRLYAKFFGFIHFASFFMEFLQSPLFHLPLWYDIHNTHRNNFYEFNYFEWRKWNFIALRTHESMVRNKMHVLYIHAYCHSWLVGYVRWIHEFASTNICSQFRCLCWYLPNINPMVAIGVFAFNLLKFYVKFN